MTTNQYVLEKATVAWILEDKETIRSFIAILKLSGYVQLPSYRMFREEAPDVQHQIVKNVMPRNQFVAVIQNLHFCDNTTIDPTNKYGKVHPLLNMVRDSLQKHAKLTKFLNIDESMIPYYGKFGQTPKQRMPLKPIQSGYKVWCLDLQGGYLYDLEVCQCKGSKNEFSDKFGLGPSVVLG